METPRENQLGDGGYRHVFAVAFPLILAQASTTIMYFVDRIMLARYDSSAMAGASFAGLAAWTVMSLFLGTISYTGTFVAQYYGAGRSKRISTAVWHGVYLAVLAGIVLVIVAFFAAPLMRLAGHSPETMVEETTYFRIFIAGGGVMMLIHAFSSLYAGLGKTYYNMLIQLPGHVLNVFLNYCLIFGRFGMPRWGTKGAATATVIASAFTCLLYGLVIRFGKVGRGFSVLRKPRFERELLGRFFAFGFPQGAQWMLDMVGWTAFVTIMYRLGEVEQQGATVAFTINHLAFMPMIGFGMATSILVGQFIGRGDIPRAERATASAFNMTLVYMVAIAAVFVLLPGPLIRLFRPAETVENWPRAYALAVVFLRFVAVYSILDGANIVYSSALRGAGDTRFVMVMMAVLSVSCLVLPAYLAVEVLGYGFLVAATIATTYIGILALAFYLRYKGGKWKDMRVIEPEGEEKPPFAGGGRSGDNAGDGEIW
ncbi:MAG: MATE family efflux transporter [Planctomycetota bacterium]|jgi:MATE family multidrug resistance protein